MKKLITSRRAVALAVAACASVPSVVVAWQRFGRCQDTPCLAFWMMVIPVCLLLVVVNLGVGFLVGDDDRQVQIGGLIGAVPLLLVDLVVWIIVSGA